jgi:hypothetical protein
MIILDPGSEFFPSPIPDPGSKSFPDPRSGSASASKTLSILTQKIVSKRSKIPDSRSRMQGSKRHRIPDPGSATLFFCQFRSTFFFS